MPTLDGDLLAMARRATKPQPVRVLSRSFLPPIDGGRMSLCYMCVCGKCGRTLVSATGKIRQKTALCGACFDWSSRA